MIKEWAMMNDDAIQAAMEKYEVPPAYPNFLYALPAMYVAKSDGQISVKEACSVMWNSLMLGLVTQGPEQKAFSDFAKNKILQFQGKTNLEDFDILADAINALLATQPPEKATMIRQSIQEMCTKVAKTSGPLFREKVLPEERAMLDKIFAQI